MTKVDFIKQIHMQHKEITQKTISNILDTIFKSMKKNIYTNNKFTYPGFGTFVIRNRKARIGRNPKNGDKINIKASKTIYFKPAKSLKMQINL